MKISGLIFFSFILTASTTKADNRDLAGNSVRLGIANVGWTVSKEYQTKKLLLDADFVFERVEQQASKDRSREQLNYMFDAHLQYSPDQTNMDYALVTFNYRAYQINRNLLSSRSVQIVRDQLELAKVILGYDDTLNIDYYAELEAGRLGRFWSYRPSDNSSFTITLGLNASLGWAWVKSVDTRYASVSNPVLGFWNVLVLEHDRWGQLYLNRYIKNGFNFDGPEETNSRGASIRFGYRKGLSGCLMLDVFLDKRSFLFSSFDMPDLYDKTKRFGVEAVCRFN